MYPDSTNPYDSFGEVYEAIGEVEVATESYEKALEINSEMLSAIEALKKLRPATQDWFNLSFRFYTSILVGTLLKYTFSRGNIYVSPTARAK
jgi:tetratricopeptide (TPR) repeat protein